MWENLKSTVNNVIKPNDNREITGEKHNNTLSAVINSLGKYSQFAGLAFKNTNPGTPDGPVFYFAAFKGVYLNFNRIEVKENEVAILNYNNNKWGKIVIGYSPIAPATAEDIRLTALIDAINSNNALKTNFEFKQDSILGVQLPFLHAAVSHIDADGQLIKGKPTSETLILVPLAEASTDADTPGKHGFMSYQDKDLLDSIPNYTISGKKISENPILTYDDIQGVAYLGEDGKIPSSLLPSYVDDVLEYDSIDNFPLIGEGGKIYLDKKTNLAYRWSGTVYVSISSSIALGETSSTAYAGDKGKKNAEDIANLKANKADKTSVYTKEEVDYLLEHFKLPDHIKAITFSVDGILLSKNENGDLVIGGNVIVEGGISMYGPGQFGDTIMDYIVVDGTSIKIIDGKLTVDPDFVGGGTVKGIKVNGNAYDEVDTNGYVTIPDYPTELAWNSITGKPSTFMPSAHTHKIEDITDIADASVSHATTADRLKKEIKIWGQPFDGSTDVEGAISNVDVINMANADTVISLYIKDGVLFIEGDLAVTGGITMYASDGVKSGMIDQVYAILDSSKFEIKNGVITIKGDIGDGKVKGATLGGVAVTLNANGILEFDAYPTTLPASDVYAWAKAATKPTYSWGEITDKPTLSISDGVITIGTNSITPLTAHQTVTLASGTNNGTLKLTVGSTTTDNIAVKGLGSAAYTASSAYAAASHTHSQYLVAASLDGYVNALTDNTSTNVFVTAISKSGKTLSYTKSFTKKSLSEVSHSGWTSAAVDALIIPDMSFIAYWNGAHNSDGKSNLTYCNKGAFGDMATASKSSYYTKTEVDTKLTDGSVTKLGTATVGSGTKHFYLNEGTATASTSTVGGTAKPMYLKSGVMTAISDTVGGTAKPIFLNAGTLTAISATVGSASKPVYLNGGSITACSYDFTSYLPLAGGTMTAGARISHADGNLYLGRSDNNGWVMCQDLCSQTASGDTYWSLRTNGTFHSKVAVVSGNTSVGSLTINGINVTKSSDGILKIDGNLIVTGGITMYATDGVASGLMEQILVDGTTIGKKADGTLYAINTGNVRSIVMGSTTYTPNDSGAVTLPEKVTWANIEGKPSTFAPSSHTHAISQITNLQATLDGKAAVSHTHSYLPLSGGTLTGTLTTVTTGTGHYNQGIRINRTATNQWATLLIGKSGTATSGTGTSTAGDGAWLIATPASSNSLIFNLNSASETVGLCLKGHGASDMKWNNNTVLHAGNYSSYALPLSGGTLTGAITTSEDVSIKNTTAVQKQFKVINNKSELWMGVNQFGESFLWTPSNTCLILGTNNSHRLDILANGNIGIGTTSPSYKLHVNGTLGVSGITTFNINNPWLSPSVIQIGRTDTSKDASKAVIGVTAGNLHIDAYHGNNMFLNYFNRGKINFGYQTDLYYISEDGSYYSGNSATATKLTSSAGSATLPIYFSDGKPVACTASSVFSNLSNSGNNLSVTVAGQNRTLTVGYASNADKVDGYHAGSFLIDRGGNYTGLIYDLPCKSIFSGNNLSDAPTTGWVSGIVLGSNWNSNHYQHYLVEAGSRWYATRAYSNGKMVNWNTFAYLTDNVASASKWATARKITLTGSVTGSVYIDGSGDVTLATTTNHTHSYLPLAGGTMTGQIQRAGQGSSWIKGRDNAMIRVNSKSGYSVLSSIKTTNGSWEIGHYDASGTYDTLLFGYYTDKAYSANDNSGQVKVQFTPGGQVTATQFNGNLNGNAATASKLGTARSIFGQNFDGSAAIGGQGVFYGTYNSTADGRYGSSALQIRENGLVGTAKSDLAYAPSIGFHWSGRSGATLLYGYDGVFYLRKVDFTTRASLDANLVGNATTATTASKLGTATVGGGTQHFYLNGGTATASTSTVGGTAKPMYLKSGVMAAISATVGSTSLPVFLNAGTITACGTSLGVSITGNAATASAVKDLSNSTTTYLNYATDDVTSPSWLCAWNKRSDNTYEIRAISPANMLKVIKALPLAGGKLTGSLEINATTGGSSYNEGIRIHPAGGWGGVILCETSNSGSSGRSANTWSIWNNEGTFGMYKDGSTISDTSVCLGYNSNLWTLKPNLLVTGGITMYSDLRKKNILSNEVLSVKEIAAAPLFRHTYKSDDNQYIHVGTSAQYWSGIHEDWFTRKDSEGYYQMELQNLGVAIGISLAREIVKYESKTDKKIRLMKKRINELEKANESLEARVKELEERRTA